MSYYTSIRCPGKRQRGMYDYCGHLLGSVEIGSESCFCVHCPICKHWWRVKSYSDGEIRIIEIGKKRLHFEKHPKKIMYEQTRNT